MNKILEFKITGQNIELSSAAMLVAGTVNEYTARFSFGADWDGYQRVAVFNADGTEREQLLTDDACAVPWEVLLPGAYLKVGVYGVMGGSRLPTIWTSHRQRIHDGAGPTDEAADPSPVLAEQMLQRMGDLGQLKTEDKSSLVAAVNEVKETGGGGGTSDHAKLKNRDAADQHPMSAITGLADAMAGKQPVGDYLTEEQDPTVPEWAKQPQKPAYTAQEVGALPATTAIPSTAADVNAEPAGAVSQHNVSGAAHSDIRLLIQGLSERLSAVADSDDATLDQLSEIVAYIKSNKSLIDAITTSKVNVADIADNLTTNVANKPLSAAQGVALKALIDAITVPDKLPNPNALTFTGAVEGSYDGSAPLSVKIPSGGTDISLGLTSAAVGQIIKVKAVDDSGKPTAWEAVDMPSGGGSNWVKVYDGSNTIAEEISAFEVDLTKSDHMKEFQLWLKLDQNTAEDWGAAKNITVSVNGETIGYFIFSVRLNSYTELYIERSLEAMNVTKRCISSVGLNYNMAQPFWMVDQQVSLQNNGKLSIHFPAPYAGKITAKVYGRY